MKKILILIFMFSMNLLADDLHSITVDTFNKLHKDEKDLIVASSRGEIILVNQLLMKSKIDVNYNFKCRTALQAATVSGHLEVVRALLNHPDINVNYFNSTCGRIPLIAAVSRGNIEIVKAILDHPSVRVNIYDNRGDTALIMAARLNNKEAIKILLAVPNIDVNHRNNNNNSALSFAQYNKNQEIVEMLQKAGAKV